MIFWQWASYHISDDTIREFALFWQDVDAEITKYKDRNWTSLEYSEETITEKPKLVHVSWGNIVIISSSNMTVWNFGAKM